MTQSTRFDEMFGSEVIQLPNIKIASNYYRNQGRTILNENKDTSPFDRREQVVITYILEGHIESTYTGLNQVFYNQNGTTSFIYAPQDNQHLLPENQDIDSVAIGIDKAFLYHLLSGEEDHWVERLLNHIERGQPFSATSVSYPISRKVRSLLKDIREPNCQGGLKGLYRQTKVCELILQQITELEMLHRHASSNKIPSRDLEKLYALRDYLEIEYLKPLTLTQLSRHSGLNLFKLKKEFKELFGVTVFEMVRGLRMNHAHAMLTNTDSTVAEVAAVLGYEHVQHFSTAFKKHYGNSPIHFRNS